MKENRNCIVPEEPVRVEVDVKVEVADIIKYMAITCILMTAFIVGARVAIKLFSNKSS